MTRLERVAERLGLDADELRLHLAAEIERRQREREKVTLEA
jgi:hypothetical protein